MLNRCWCLDRSTPWGLFSAHWWWLWKSTASTKTCLIWKEHWQKDLTVEQTTHAKYLLLDSRQAWGPGLSMRFSPDGHLLSRQLCIYLSYADNWIPFSTVQKTLLTIRCPDGFLYSLTDSKRLQCCNLKSRRLMAAYILWFGWRWWGNVSWQRWASLRSLPFARSYVRCMTATPLNGYTFML
jgi:hypothetical protein